MTAATVKAQTAAPAHLPTRLKLPTAPHRQGSTEFYTKTPRLNPTHLLGLAVSPRLISSRVDRERCRADFANEPGAFEQLCRWDDALDANDEAVGWDFQQRQIAWMFVQLVRFADVMGLPITDQRVWRRLDACFGGDPLAEAILAVTTAYTLVTRDAEEDARLFRDTLRTSIQRARKWWAAWQAGGYDAVLEWADTHSTPQERRVAAEYRVRVREMNKAAASAQALAA